LFVPYHAELFHIVALGHGHERRHVFIIDKAIRLDMEFGLIGFAQGADTGQSGVHLAAADRRAVPVEAAVKSIASSIDLTCAAGCMGGAGKFRLMLWFWIGIVMIIMMIITSMTSIKGVMFISIITSGKPAARALMPMESPFHDIETNRHRASLTRSV